MSIEDLSLSEQMTLGEEARRLIDSPAFEMAAGMLIERYFEEFCDAAPGSPDIERLHMKIQIARDFGSALRVVASAGEIAKRNRKRNGVA